MRPSSENHLDSLKDHRHTIMGCVANTDKVLWYMFLCKHLVFLACEWAIYLCALWPQYNSLYKLFAINCLIIKLANVIFVVKKMPNFMLINNLANFPTGFAGQGFSIGILLFGSMELHLPTPGLHPPSWGTRPCYPTAYPPPKAKKLY